MYALGATPEQIQKHYNNNKTAQRPQQPLHNHVTTELCDFKKYQQYLGKEKYYYDYLVYFQGEIEKKGYQEVINEYLLKGDARADDMLGRMFSGVSRDYSSVYENISILLVTGFLHPIIHLGFGVEFQQPAIVAEALAQAAVHDSWLNPFLLGAEKAAASTGNSKSLVGLLDEIRADRKLSTAAHWSDSNKIRDGILVRAPNEMIKYASQFKVGTEELAEKTAEATNAASEAIIMWTDSGKILIRPSILRRRRSASTEADQVRLLLHPLCQQLHILLVFPPRALDQCSEQSQAS